MMGFLLCNDNREMDRKVHHVACCMFYYNIPIDALSLTRIQARKGIILYYKINIIMA
jgi:hypothetical protein